MSDLVCWNGFDNVHAHPSAVIDTPCTIGPGTVIWHFCHVMTSAKIGKNCALGQNVYVAAGATVGNGCKIQNNVSLYSGVTLEDGVFVGPSAVFTNVTTPRAFVSRASEFGLTLVERGASIGANATILCGITIGAYALIGAGAVVTKDVKAHAVIVGVPGKQHGWACKCGEVLLPWLKSGTDAHKLKLCRRCHRRYALLDGGLKLDVLDLG